LDEYFRLAGWDGSTGNPTPETMSRLGLAWVS
jgi:aldehyde:ferredoxin oxidoreductase